MNEFYQLPKPVFVITPVTKESVAGAFGTVGWTDATWPTSNKSVLIPFTINYTIIVKTLFCFNGRTVSGNLDIGIYDMGAALRIHTGAKGQAGTNRVQAFSIANTELEPGSYHLAMVMDNTTGQIYRRAAGITAQAAAYGIAQVTSNFPLAQNIEGLRNPISTATIPFFGLSTRSFI
jgi:hypothetical protein